MRGIDPHSSVRRAGFGALFARLLNVGDFPSRITIREMLPHLIEPRRGNGCVPRD